MSFLSKLSQLKKTNPTTNSRKTIQSTPVNNEPSYVPEKYVREADPAVQRLKELRRKELEKKALENPKKHQKATKKSLNNENKSTRTKRAPKDNHNAVTYKRKNGSKSTLHPQNMQYNSSKRDPIKKLSFDELMKQAETNKVNPGSSKSTKNDNVSNRPRINRPGFKTARVRGDSRSVSRENDLRRSQNTNGNERLQEDIRKSPNKFNEKPSVVVSLPNQGFAKPNEKFKRQLDSKKLHSKRRYSDDDEGSDLDDFIEDDEEEAYERSYSRDPGYDRDEIWAMFNNGRRHNDYDRYDDEDDEDDMEANELDIMMEEERASKIARLEDKKEDSWLKKHDADKKRRKLTR